MKKHLKQTCAVIAVLCTVPLSLMVLVTSSEAIPDRARFLVNKEEKYVVPRPVPGQYIFRPLPNQGDDEAFTQFDGTVSWGELKNTDHPYHDFGLPKNPEWDDFVLYGREVSLLRSMLFPPPSRWDDDGNWRY